MNSKTTSTVFRLSILSLYGILTFTFFFCPNSGISQDNGKMYWTQINFGAKIRRADLDGSNVEDLVTSGLIDPHGIALDLADGKMYIVDRRGKSCEPT